MAYDLNLALRVRGLLEGRKGVTEKAMFGGLAFLLEGKMFCGVLGKELLARIGPEAHDAAVAKPYVRIMDFTGRPMRGYVFVGPEATTTRAKLERWVNDCRRHVATLPDKPARKSVAARRAKAKRLRPASPPDSRSVRRRSRSPRGRDSAGTTPRSRRL